MDEQGSGLHSAGRTAAYLLTALWLLFVSVVALWLYQSYDAAKRGLDDRLEASTKIVATNAEWIYALAAQALRRIDEALPERIAAADGEQTRDINAAVEDLPGQVQAYVVDRSGQTIYSTNADARPINITDREYFSALANGASEYVSSLLISRLNGKPTFVISRRLQRGGAFAGAAVVSFETDVLRPVWEAVDLGENSTVSLIRTDGQLIARYPPAKAPLDMKDYVLFTQYLPEAPAGTYEALSPLDGQHRMVGYRLVAGTPFLALAAADYGDALAPFRRNAMAVGLLAAATSIGAAIAGWWIWRLYRQDERTGRQLRAAHDENALLLREIHHRVKNNLQAVQSLLRMQGLPADVQQALSMRIMAMIAVHEQIYKHDAFAWIELRELIPAVVDKLVEAYSVPVVVDYDIAPLAVHKDQATPVALLLNEIVTNSIKYAFAGNPAPRLSVRAASLGEGCIRLAIADNGAGFDPKTRRRGMGSRLVDGVIQQLNGSFRYEISEGTTAIAELTLASAEPAKAE